jgi:5S rRNA maturation endonuclease (ribonuclease M5)
MGASLLALAIPRRVVLTEGSSDCVLYPTLLRQATGESELEFRFAPGLSSASDATLRELDSEGGRVAFLVDGDESGDRIRTRLEKAGVAQAHIISIRELTGSPVTIEDFVSAEVFAAALNALLHRWNDLDSEIQVSELRDNNRWTLCEEWCEQHGVAPPSKLQLAQEVVDRRRSPDAVGDEPSEPFKVISDFYQPALSELLGRVRNIVKPS